MQKITRIALLAILSTLFINSYLAAQTGNQGAPEPSWTFPAWMQENINKFNNWWKEENITEPTTPTLGLLGAEKVINGNGDAATQAAANASANGLSDDYEAGLNSLNSATQKASSSTAPKLVAATNYYKVAVAAGNQQTIQSILARMNQLRIDQARSESDLDESANQVLAKVNDLTSGDAKNWARADLADQINTASRAGVISTPSSP